MATASIGASRWVTCVDAPPNRDEPHKDLFG
jgi:hypothetical protein